MPPPFPSIRSVENKTSFGPVSAKELSLKKAQFGEKTVNKLKIYQSKDDSFFILLIIFHTSQNIFTPGNRRNHPVLKSIGSYVNV